jgi:fatty-acyl-CoA synthase
MIYPNETFDAEATLKAISEEKATAIYGVPMFCRASILTSNNMTLAVCEQE